MPVRTFAKMLKQAIEERYKCDCEGRPFSGHWLVTVDEFAAISAETHQFDPNNAFLAGIPLGVVPNGWRVAQ